MWWWWWWRSRVAVPVKGASFIPSRVPFARSSLSLPGAPPFTAGGSSRFLVKMWTDILTFSPRVPGEQAGQCFKGLLWSFPALLGPFSSYFIGQLGGNSMFSSFQHYLG